MFHVEKNNSRVFGVEAKLLVVGLIFLSLSTVASGQVYQVDRGNSGRRMDASTMVGSGGRNTLSGVNSRYNLGQKKTELMMENRTTGLSGFHGKTGYYAPDQLNLSLPSSRLDTFQRQSVGVQDVLRGGVYKMNPYFSRSSTTLSPRSIAIQESTRQAVLPGQGMTTPAQTATQKLYRSATQEYQPLMPNEPINALLGNALGVQPGNSSRRSSQYARRVERRQVASRGGENLFAMPHLQDRTNLAQELSEYSEDQLPGSLLIQPLGQALDKRVDSRVVKPMESGYKPESIAEKLRGQKDAAGKGTEKNLLLPSAAIHKSVVPKANQDAFLDLLVRMKQKKLTDQTLDDGDQPDRDEQHQKPAAVTAQPGSTVPGGANGFTAGNRVVLHRLAGESGDLFNRYMTRAKKELDAGRFYEASQYYELASVSRPTNPLARLGGSLAKFAAEEWYNSARNLQHALELFPPLMETKLDLTKLMPAGNLSERLDALELWVTKVHDKPSLVFLAAFMQHNAGHDKLARKHAENLKKSEYASPLLKMYADYILTGKLPTELQRNKDETKKKR